MSEELTVPKNTDTKEVIPRNADGTIQKGAKLGKGRKKGSRNKATILREKMERKVSIKLSRLGPDVIDKVGEQALAADGCRQSQKMILDRIAPVRKAEDGVGSRDTAVHITISNLTRDNVKEVLGGHTIDGEFERED